LEWAHNFGSNLNTFGRSEWSDGAAPGR